MTSDFSDRPDLRPATLDDYINQDQIKASLRVAILAAKRRGRTLDHCLFYGPAGIGKTTLAGILASEMGGRLVVTSGPAIEKPGEIASLCAAIGAGDVLFIDEIHRLPRAVEEVLYPVMEDGRLDVTVGTGEQTRALRLSLPPFTLVGATTRFGMLTPPLRDRFGHVHRLEYYSPEAIARIVKRSAAIMGAEIDGPAAAEIAKRSRGTPRKANRLLARAVDHALILGTGRITENAARSALDALEIDACGLEKIDRDILDAIIRKFAGGPVGLATLAAAVNADAGTVSDVCEPFLQSIGFITRTQRGRIATPAAWSHMGIRPSIAGAVPID